MSGKYYAVRVGRHTGIYRTWFVLSFYLHTIRICVGMNVKVKYMVFLVQSLKALRVMEKHSAL